MQLEMNGTEDFELVAFWEIQDRIKRSSDSASKCIVSEASHSNCSKKLNIISNLNDFIFASTDLCNLQSQLLIISM